MAWQNTSWAVHLAGEVLDPRRGPVPAVLRLPLVVNTPGRRVHVEGDPSAPVTPLGQLVFFSQFLATSGLCQGQVKSCPLAFTSNNAPPLNDLLGTGPLAILSGWTARRRVVVRHRRRERATEKESTHELGCPLLVACGPAPEHEHQILETNLGEEILSLADLYRQRAGAGHVYDELTNLSLFLSGLQNTAEQLSPSPGWERIRARILTPLLTPRPPGPLPAGEPETAGRKTGNIRPAGATQNRRIGQTRLPSPFLG